MLSKLDKILAVAPRIDVSALRAGIARTTDMEGFSPPNRVLASLCRQMEDCEVTAGQTIIDKRPRSPKALLSDTEQTIVRVFNEHGPLLTSKQALTFLTEAGTNEHTAHIYLGVSPLLRRLAPGVYSLIGATVSPGEVNELSKTVAGARRRVLQDYGVAADGSGVWATYKVSEGSLNNGIVSCPSGIRDYVASTEYDMYTVDGVLVGQLSVGDAPIWGLRPFFSRRGGEVGDYLRIKLEFQDDKAVVELGHDQFEPI